MERRYHCVYLKNGDKEELKNYRPLGILTTIYKIADPAVADRIQPVLNLLTTYNQCAYKSKRSTMDRIQLCK